MEAPLLNGSASDGDSPPVKRFSDAWAVFLIESRKLWVIAAPIGLNIFCLYGINSTTQIFVGHLGNLELSAVAISLSVISNFSFGFLVYSEYLAFYRILLSNQSCIPKQRLPGGSYFLAAPCDAADPTSRGLTLSNNGLGLGLLIGNVYTYYNINNGSQA